MTLRLHRALIVLGLISLLAITGCQDGPAMGTVHGDVTLDGQPLKEGAIRFVPVEGDAPSTGGNISDGKFTTRVALGKHRVEINASKVVGKYKAYNAPDSPVVDDVVELIPSAYNTNSPLTIDVQRGSQDVRYDLKKKPSP